MGHAHQAISQFDSPYVCPHGSSHFLVFYRFKLNNTIKFINIYKLINKLFWNRSYTSQLPKDNPEALKRIPCYSCKSIVTHTRHLMKSSSIWYCFWWKVFQSAEFNYISHRYLNCKISYNRERKRERLWTKSGIHQLNYKV